MWGDDLEQLNKAFGRKVASVSVGDARAFINFDDGATLTLTLDADCCSRSYYADAKQFDALVGSTITSIEERDLGQIPNPESDCTRAHCLVFTTDRGHETIDWRNDSNGYYDGSVMPSFQH